MEETSRSDESLIEKIQDLPPSAKLVFKILHYEGDLTQQEIVTETLLSPRTVRYAVSRLEKNGIISSQISFVDARQRVYSLSTTQDGDTDDIE